MFSTDRFRRAVFAGVLVFAASFAAAQSVPDQATLYRVFLRDGTSIVSYGEFARVADRVVISLPIGGSAASPGLQVLSIPADGVDWDRTDAYADAARAARYAATSGPSDFALLNDAVTTALNDIAVTTDTTRKVAMALEARQNVMRWAAEHYGYRAPDVARLAGLFDDVVAEARTAAGEKNSDLSFVATMAAPPSVSMLPLPTLQESVEQALRASSLAPDATERISLLHAIQDTLGTESSEWADPVRARVWAALALETRADRQYSALTRDAIRNADQRVKVGDVSGVERLIQQTLHADDRFGQRRPQEMASLLAVLDRKLESARRLRLARDQWAERAAGVLRYRQALSGPLGLFRLSRTSLDEIRRLAGPSRLHLAELETRTTRAARLLDAIRPPPEGTDVQGLLKRAIGLASRAADTRKHAITSGQMSEAWEASSAAAGALMLFDRAVDALQALSAAPIALTNRHD